MTCGKILQIQLTNFMCHSNLTVTLGKNVNFVIGRNGSKYMNRYQLLHTYFQA